MNFEILKTNIVCVTADAIVLPANTALKEGSGVSTAIFQAAGRRQLTKACEKIGSCEVGSAVPTLAYELDAKYIVHAIVPRWIDGEHDEYDLLSSAYLTALNVADAMGCISIAFPLLASGNNGYDLDLAFQIAKESFSSFEGSNLRKIILVIYGNRIAAIVKEQGYTFAEIPEDLHKKAQKQSHKEKAKKMAADGKEVAQRFLEDQIQKGLDYLKDENNRAKVLAAGVGIAKAAYAIAKKSKKN